MSKDGLTEFFESHEDKNPLADNEYIKDGMKYCSLCNTIKQCTSSFKGKEYIIGVMCKCEEEKYQVTLAEKEKAKKAKEVEVCKRGIIDKLYLDMTFNKSDSKMVYAEKYVENFDKYKAENIGLMLIGDKGTGKTFAAACIANALAEKCVSVFMANVLYLTNAMGKFDNQEFMDSLQRYSLLIIDDFGAERQTDYVCEQIYNLIETRYRSKKPLIITSNITLEQLKKCDDIRIVRTYDRLKQMCHPIIVNGESRRIKIANERYAKLVEELG